MKRILFALSIGFVSLVSGESEMCKTVDNRGIDIEICTNAGYMDSASTLPGIPTGSTSEYPLDAVTFQISGFSPNGHSSVPANSEQIQFVPNGGVTVSIEFPENYVPTSLKKCTMGYPVENQKQLNRTMIMPYVCTPITNATLNGNTWSYYIQDNGPLDTNGQYNVIVDPLVFVFPVQVPLSNSAKVLLAILFAFGAFFMMHRRRIA